MSLPLEVAATHRAEETKGRGRGYQTCLLKRRTLAGLIPPGGCLAMVRVDGPCPCWAEDPGEGDVGRCSSTLPHLYFSDVPLVPPVGRT